MIVRLVLLIAIALGAAACGVKSDLEVPKGAEQPPHGAPDPSKPPKPLG